MEKINVNFESEGVLLNGIIDLANIENPFVLFLPGISGKALSERFDIFAQGLNSIGINIFRFNFRGYEEGNSIDNFSLEDELNDIKNAISFLNQNNYNIVNLGLIGRSFGGLRALLYEDERIKAKCLIAPATFFGPNGNIPVMKNVEYGIIENIKNFMIDESFFDNYFINTLIIHGNHDEIVSIDNSKDFITKIKGKKDFLEIDGAGHGLDQKEYIDIYLPKLVTFFKDNLL